MVRDDGAAVDLAVGFALAVPADRHCGGAGQSIGLADVGGEGWGGEGGGGQEGCAQEVGGAHGGGFQCCAMCNNAPRRDYFHAARKDRREVAVPK